MNASSQREEGRSGRPEEAEQDRLADRRERLRYRVPAAVLARPAVGHEKTGEIDREESAAVQGGRARGDEHGDGEHRDGLQPVVELGRHPQDEDHESGADETADEADAEFLDEAAGRPAAGSARSDRGDRSGHHRDADRVVEAGLALEDRPRGRVSAVTERRVDRCRIRRCERDPDQDGGLP